MGKEEGDNNTILSMCSLCEPNEYRPRPVCSLHRALSPWPLHFSQRCPDALFTEAYLQPIFHAINDKINLEFVYIGNVDEEEEYGVACKHGTAECELFALRGAWLDPRRNCGVCRSGSSWRLLVTFFSLIRILLLLTSSGAGNIHQLCVQHSLSNAVSAGTLTQSQAQQKLWDFVRCEDEDGLSRIGQPGLAQRCLETVHGPSWNKGVRTCTEGKQGKDLLLSSVQQAQRAGIVNSATIQLEGQTICVRDGGEWKQCPGGSSRDDIVGQVLRAWEAKQA